MDPSTLAIVISIVAALAATISAASAWVNSRTTRANLRMQKADFEERHDSIRAYLIDGVSWDTTAGERAVLFACSYTNAANAPNTLVRFELALEALDRDGKSTRVILDSSLDIAPSLHEIQKMQVPLNLPARSTASGWIGFKIPRHLLGGGRIDKYEIAALTSSGKSLSLNCYLVRRLTNEHRKT